MSNRAAARATFSVSARSCGLCLGGTGGMVVDEDKLRGEQFEGSLDDKPMIDHRTRNTALAHPLPLDDAVRGSEIDRPALFIGKIFEPGPKEPDHIVARSDALPHRSQVRRQSDARTPRQPAADGPGAGPVRRSCEGAIRPCAAMRASDPPQASSSASA